MIKRLFLFIGIITMLVSCNEPEARRPVSAKSGTFMRASIDRNKELLALEESIIKGIIEKDTVNKYLSSSNGYWYYYNVMDTTQNYLPKKGDVLRINYDIRTLENKTIYTKEEIGEISFHVDKEDYFPGLRTGVKLMKKGETITFLFPSVVAYGYHGDKNKIGTNEPIMSTVTLLDILETSKDSLQ